MGGGMGGCGGGGMGGGAPFGMGGAAASRIEFMHVRKGRMDAPEFSAAALAGRRRERERGTAPD